jgi:CspA family cold shock protein
MATGSVRWFSSERGFGFIAPDMGPRDVFLHAIIVAEAGLDAPAPGDRVEFDLVQQRDGRLSALNLRRLSQDPESDLSAD